MEVKNSSDRTIFTTEEEFCLYTYGSIISSNTNGLVVTNYDEDDFSDGKLLFARPQNGESGAICGKLTSSNYTFFWRGRVWMGDVADARRRLSKCRWCKVYYSDSLRHFYPRNWIWLKSY